MKNNLNVITLNDGIAEVLIAPSMGASILSYNTTIGSELRSIFRGNIEAETVLDSCNFALVPFSNRIRNGSFNWQGQQITLPLNNLPEKHTNHGHGWQSSWDIIELSNDSLILQYSHRADEWPFPYIAKQKISLQRGQLTIQLWLKNIGTKTMPAGLGLHPYFTRTKLSYLKTDVDKMWAVDDEGMPTTIVESPQGLSSDEGMIIAQHSLDNALVGFKQQAKIAWPEWGMAANISTSSHCKFLVVYSPKEKDFFCVEPVTHCTDAINLFNSGRKDTGLQHLAPGEEFSMWMKVAPRLIA
ncbi:MAG: aldose 1-epimerase [Colwellia sp.]|nr:aldose 1-epimerase [Colwellia sp.]